MKTETLSCSWSYWKCFQFFDIENNVCCRLIIYGLYYVEVGSSYADFFFLKSFTHKWVLNFVKGFFFIYWDDHIVFILQFVIMVYHIDWFAYIEESLHPWNKTNLITVYELLNVLLTLVWCLVSVSVWRRLMSSCQLMFLGVRSSLKSGFGLKPPTSSYRSYFYSIFKTSPSVQHHW